VQYSVLKIGPMALSDIPLSAIDFHVSPIVEELCSTAAIAERAQACCFPFCMTKACTLPFLQNNAIARLKLQPQPLFRQLEGSEFFNYYAECQGCVYQITPNSKDQVVMCVAISCSNIEEEVLPLLGIVEV